MAAVGPVVGLLTKAIQQAEASGQGDPMMLLTKLAEGMRGNTGAGAPPPMGPPVGPPPTGGGDAPAPAANHDGGSAEKAPAAGKGGSEVLKGIGEAAKIAKSVAGKGKGKGGGGGGGGKGK